MKANFNWMFWKPRRLVSSFLFFLLVLLVLYFSYPYALNGLARFLVVSDRLEKADVILVLAGDTNGERVAQGVELYKQGYAKHLLMSGGSLTWNLTYAGWMKKQAVELGVPGPAVLLQDRSTSTIDDAKFSLPIVKEHGFRSVIVVTSPYHTRRAAAVFKKIFGRQGIKVLIYPVQHSNFEPHDWWRRHEDTAFVVWEYVARVMYLLKGY
jgi:uncharacterized SAM-binding protein YcdF (DUF218 family)